MFIPPAANLPICSCVKIKDCSRFILQLWLMRGTLNQPTLVWFHEDLHESLVKSEQTSGQNCSSPERVQDLQLWSVHHITSHHINHANFLCCKIISVLKCRLWQLSPDVKLTLHGHIKTAEKRTNIQQYDDWYTGCWWVGCYIWYSKEGPGRAVAQPSRGLHGSVFFGPARPGPFNSGPARPGPLPFQEDQAQPGPARFQLGPARPVAVVAKKQF